MGRGSALESVWIGRWSSLKSGIPVRCRWVFGSKAAESEDAASDDFVLVGCMACGAVEPSVAAVRRDAKDLFLFKYFGLLSVNRPLGVEGREDESGG